jgi:cysteinyl-tRNA synthetase
MDLNAPRGLADMWNLLKDAAIPGDEKLSCLYQMDRILGFNLSEIQIEAKEVESVPEDIQLLLQERLEAKREKNYTRADELRAIVEGAGYQLKDTPNGTTVTKSCNQNQG